MAHTQAPIKMDMYMELPAAIETKHGDSQSHVSKFLKNLYGQKQAGCIWNEFLSNKLFAFGFEQSKVDECVFYQGSVIFIVCVDDGMFLKNSERQLSNIMKKLQDVGLDIEGQGNPADLSMSTS